MNIGTSYCSIEQPVEPAVTARNGSRDRFVVRGQRALEVEGHDAGFGGAQLCDFGVDGLQLAHGAAQQDDFRARGRERQRDGAADAGSRTRHHDGAALEFSRGRLVCARVE
jgi:hypothetical protein